jgi:hypothetical protein
VHSCLATQFIVLYKNIFKKISNAPFDEAVAADVLLSGLTTNKMILNPFISIQKNFGYSDVTSVHKEQPDLVQQLFKQTECRLNNIQKVHLNYLVRSGRMHIQSRDTNQ